MTLNLMIMIGGRNLVNMLMMSLMKKIMLKYIHLKDHLL